MAVPDIQDTRAGETSTSESGTSKTLMNEIVTAVSGAPVTFERPPPAGVSSYLANPGLPRANTAPCVELPDGAVKPLPGYEHFSVLQQHVQFFDRDNNGIIYPWETYSGFRAIGWNMLASFIFAMFINTGFSYPTSESWIPNPLLPVYIKNIHRAKHGNDSGCYDHEGRFIPQRFEEIFSKFDKENKKALTAKELWEMTQSNRDVMDFFGYIAAKGEWLVLYYTAANKDGMVSKEELRASFDGTLWYKIEKERKMAKSKKKA
ncbi:hypothetical protein HDU76_000771 [Blyttiomyces sp. JEL0837]|nr:hypothetical protein HDU76_000771 [Blyttiomyces sp. JEL0837]